MVQRHVRRGRAHLDRQREIVAGLRARNHPTEKAEELFVSFEEIQAEHEAHLDRLTGARPRLGG